MNVLAKENDYEIRPIVSLKDMLDSSAELYADNPAYLVKKMKGGPYVEKTYTTLKHDVDALGTAMLDLGLKDAKVAIIGENCYQWIATYYAVANGVGTVVPLDKELNKEEVQNLITIAGCQAVFFTANYEKYFENMDISSKFLMKVYEDAPSVSSVIGWQSLVTKGDALVKKGNRTYIDVEINPEEVRMLLFTSGTTGDAKAVMLSHKNLASNIMDTCKVVEIFPEDRTLSILPIHHTFECTMGQLLVVYRGAATAYCEGLKYVTKNMVESGTSVLIGVPLIFESVYDKVWK
ncbi:MAG: AMP-binding protein, partial [Anaerovorax sp.]